MLYFKAIRLYIQTSNNEMKTIHTYLKYSENLAKFYCKMLLMDVDLVALKPSILGATAVFFGIVQSQ
jgi:hypothetical protein